MPADVTCRIAEPSHEAVLQIPSRIIKRISDNHCL